MKVSESESLFKLTYASIRDRSDWKMESVICRLDAPVLTRQKDVFQLEVPMDHHGLALVQVLEAPCNPDQPPYRILKAVHLLIRLHLAADDAHQSAAIHKLLDLLGGMGAA